jgi:uncharacterized protein (TIGR02246 family)
MRKLRLVVATGILGMASMAAGATEFAPGSAQACWIDAFRAMDADAVAACYADDAVLWFPGGPMAKGRQAIHDGFAGYFAASTVKEMTIEEMGRESMGDALAAWGTWKLTVVDKQSGAERTMTGRYSDVSKKIDGKWLYVMDHPSDDPPPPPAPMQ